MRQDPTPQDLASQVFTTQAAPKDFSAIVLVCVVLASGAAFGMAALAALRHFDLDFGSIHGDLIADRVARSHSATAWWAWCGVAVAAVLVGPLSATLARSLVANWWLMRGLRLIATAALVLGLAAIGQLRPAASTLAFTSHAAVGLIVVAVAAMLAALGARILGGFPHLGARSPRAMPAQPARAFVPLQATPAPRGGGSANLGLPFRRQRQPHALVPGSFSLRRGAIAAFLTLVVLAAVAVLGGASVLLEAAAPGVVRDLAASKLSPAGAPSHARTLVLALLPAAERPPVLRGPVVALAPPPVPAVVPPPVVMAEAKPVEPPAPRQRAISAAVVAESELTFAKGYSRRRAAQLVASMMSPPTIPRLTAPIDINKVRASSLRLTQPQDRRVSRPVADNRFFADQRFVPDSRHGADRRHRASARERDRYADYRYADWNSWDRLERHGRQHARDRGGDNRFARAEPSYRPF
jgi:hypothetical protein